MALLYLFVEVKDFNSLERKIFVMHPMM